MPVLNNLTNHTLINCFNLTIFVMSKLNKKILSQYASGYNLYTWANEVLPKNSITMISHRSYYFAEKKMIYVGMANYFKNETKNGKEFFLKQIKEEKPKIFLTIESPNGNVVRRVEGDNSMGYNEVYWNLRTYSYRNIENEVLLINKLLAVIKLLLLFIILRFC